MIFVGSLQYIIIPMNFQTPICVPVEFLSGEEARYLHAILAIDGDLYLLSDRCSLHLCVIQLFNEGLPGLTAHGGHH